MDIKTKFKIGTEKYSMLVEDLDRIALLGWMNSGIGVRGIAADKLRDEKGRIEVDVTKPHILENMDYFRKAAIHFEKHGFYSNAYPSRDINSPYRKFWDEEKRRCIEGYVRKKDGEWVTGYHYFYLNYSPIMKAEAIGKKSDDGSIKAERVEGFPDMWDGDYLFYHYVDKADLGGKFGSVLKTRGRGYSYKAASMLIRNYQLFEKSLSYAIAADTEYLDTDGILNKAWGYLDFNTKHVGFSKKLRLKDTMMEKKAGYKKPSSPAEYGSLASVIGVTLKNNPGKARGKRGKLLLWEEAGIFPNLLKAWRIAQKSVEQGNMVYGIMLAFGTGGEKGANFEGLKALFYKPRAYRILAIPNVFDRNVAGQVCGFFSPEYLNRSGCYDVNGNSNVITAMEEVIERRILIKYSATDPDDIAQAKAEEPITPQEAVMVTSGTIFPLNELKTRLADIIPREESFVSSHYTGDLVWVQRDKVQFKPVFNKTPIREWPIKRSDTTGSIEIYDKPAIINGEIPSMRYIGGVDPVDDEFGTSMFSVKIFDMFTDKIVATWIGRHRTAAQNFDIAMKLAVYYNAQINYENKLKGMFAHFDKKNMLRYLADTPVILKDMDYVGRRDSYGNKAKGSPPTQQINAWGRRLQADWMLQTNEYSGNLNYMDIRDIGYIREAISWNIDGNFDRISDGIMLWILREDRIKQVTASRGNSEEDDYNEDLFFSKEEFGEVNEYEDLLTI